jgi:hypothetical protein
VKCPFKRLLKAVVATFAPLVRFQSWDNYHRIAVVVGLLKQQVNADRQVLPAGSAASAFSAAMIKGDIAIPDKPGAAVASQLGFSRKASAPK